MEDHQPKRLALKTHQPNWQQKLRENCLKRVEEDRNRLLWEMRIPTDANLEEMEIMESVTNLLKVKDSSGDFDGLDTAFAEKEILERINRQLSEIVYDEFEEIKESSMITTSPAKYDGLDTALEFCMIESEDIMKEMQKIFFEGPCAGQTRKDQEDCERMFQKQLDDILALAAFEHLELNEDQVCDENVRCPICKEGKLRQNDHHIYCTLCICQIDKGDEANLHILRLRVSEVHSKHCKRGCKLKPKFCMETRFNLTAMYIKCEACSTFEIVI